MKEREGERERGIKEKREEGKEGRVAAQAVMTMI